MHTENVSGSHVPCFYIDEKNADWFKNYYITEIVLELGPSYIPFQGREMTAGNMSTKAVQCD